MSLVIAVFCGPSAALWCASEQVNEARAIVELASFGALSASDVAAWVDRTMLSMPSPPTWLIEASLARSPEDRLHWLREAGPGEAPALARLGGALLACQRGRMSAYEVAHLGLRLDLPPGVGAAVHELEEDACCAHEFDGVPQPERVDAALDALAGALARQGPTFGLLERLQEECTRLPNNEPRVGNGRRTMK